MKKFRTYRICLDDAGNWAHMRGKDIIANNMDEAKEVAKQLDPSLKIGGEIPPIPPEGQGKLYRAIYTISTKNHLPEVIIRAYNKQDAHKLANDIDLDLHVMNEYVETDNPGRAKG